MGTEQLAAAFGCARGVLAGVGTDQLDDPTPCASWTVADLVDHMNDAARYAANAMGGEGAPADDADLLARYDRTIEVTLAAFGAEGALTRTVHLPFAEMAAGDFLRIVTTDQFVHAWDLARATGQPTDLDPALAESLLGEVVAVFPDEFRGDDGVAPIGPAQPAPAGSGPADRLAAFLGRAV